MQPLKILQVAIEKRILVVPFDLKSDSSGAESSNVIDFM
jgi:hypothetical protein